jgi:hypothetical protein
MNALFADKVFRMAFILIFMLGLVGMPSATAMAQSPLPQLTLEKSASPDTYSQTGDVIQYNYLLTNTGSGTLSGPFEVTDDKITVNCPANIMPTSLSNTVLFDHFDAVSLAQSVHGTPTYQDGPAGFGQAVELSSGAWLRYNVPGWYQWPSTYDPTGKAGSVDLWVYPKKYGIGLVNFNWNYTDTVPPAGHILGLGIDSNGKVSVGTWSAIYGPSLTPLSASDTVIPLDQWTHLAFAWGEAGTRLYVNGVQDAYSPDNLYPALNSTFYVYVPNWGEPGMGSIDELRITSNAQTNFGVRTLAFNETITCTASYAVIQDDLDRGSVTNTAQARAFLITTPVDSNVATATVSVSHTSPELHPHLAAFVFNNSVGAFQWPLDSQITLTIDDPDNGPGIDFTDTQPGVPTGDEPRGAEASFQLTGLTLQPGQLLTMTDGTTTKTHTVTSLALGGGRADNDTVWGTAEQGSVIDVVNMADYSISRHVTTDGQGNWLADFSLPGNAGQDSYDIQYGDNMMVMQNDEDGDHTQFNWHANVPSLILYPEGNTVFGDDWNWDRPIDITIDDPANGVGVDYSTSIMPGIRSWYPEGSWFERTLDDFVLKPGQTVTATNGYFTKVHVIKNVQVTNVDPVHDTVSGTAEPGTRLNSWIQNVPGSIQRDATAGDDGNWTFDFSVLQNPGDVIYDIGPGSNGFGKNFDEDGDATNFAWKTPNPRIFGVLGDQRVYAWGWPAGTPLTMTIDDPATLQSPDHTGNQVATAFEDWDHGFEWGISFDVRPGYLIVVSGGGLTKELEVAPLTVTSVDMEMDTVSGTGDPGFEIHVGLLCDDQGCTSRNIYVDTQGNWLADFSVPGNKESETVFDIRPGSGTGVYEIDADGDATNVDWNLPNPAFQVRASDDRVEGWEWTLGDTVTIEVNDPSTPQEIDYSATATVGVADWDPNQTWFGVNTSNYDLKVGDTVKVTAGDITKELYVSDYRITDVDLDTDTVRGIAGPGQRVNIWTCWQNDPCVNRDETAGDDGYWITNFAVPGEQDWEQQTANLRPGSWIDSSVSDEDGDNVMSGWYVEIPNIEANPGADWVVARGWPIGTVLTLTIDDPSNGPGIDKTMNITMGPSSWDPNDIAAASGPMSDFDLQPGHIIKVTDGNTEATYVPTHLSVTGFDLEADTISGIASPGMEVQVWVGETGPHILRYVTSDALTGTWTADYGRPGQREDEQQLVDLQPGSIGFVKEIDANGNATHIDWQVAANQPPVANAGPDQSVYALDPVTLDASGSTDPEAGPLTYEWDLDGDGQYDDASGLTATVSFNQAGSHVVGLQVTDDGGLKDTDRVTVKVSVWTLKGFYQPVDMNGVYNLAKGGSTVPFKFEIFAGSTELTSTTSVKSFSYVQMACDASVPVDTIEFTSMSASGLRYDNTAGQFIYNWKTPNNSGKCYRVTVTTLDGSLLLAYFKLK